MFINMKGLLECFRAASKIGVTGELGVDIANGKVANGKRFKAKVIYNNGICNTEWKDSNCCYTLNSE